MTKKQPSTQKQSLWLKLASFACVVHCMGVPLLIAFAPVLGEFFESLWVELTMLVTSIIVGVWVVYSGYCNHKKVHAVYVYVIGAVLWGTHSLFEFKGIGGAKIYFVIGTLFVLGSYIMSHRYLKCCPSDHAH